MEKYLTMKMLILFCFLGLQVSCVKMKRIQICSTDHTKCITIFNDEKIRYIANGQLKKMPDENYVKLDVSQIDYLGDNLHLCWDDDNYEWLAVIHNSIVIENKLDSTRFNFKSTLPVDERGIPTEKIFIKKGCVIFDFYTNSLSPLNGAIVKYY